MKTKKKSILTLVLTFVLIFCGSFLTACGSKVKDIIITSGTPVIVQDANPDWSDVEAKVVFDNGDEKNVSSDKLVFSSVDTSTIGVKDVYVNYKGSNVKVKIQVEVISKTEINATITANAWTYDNAMHKSVTVNTLETDTVVYSTDDKQTWVETVPEFKNAGTYYVWVKVSRAHYNDLIVKKTVVAQKREITITAVSDTLTYGDAAPANYEINYTGFATGHSKDTVLETMATATCEYEQGDDVGSYDIVVSGASIKTEHQVNYDINYKNSKLIVNPQSNMGVTVKGVNATYNGEPYELIFTGVETETDKLYYRLSETDEWTEGTYSHTDACEDGITVYVKVERENFEPETYSAIIKIEKLGIDKPTAKDMTYSYTGENISFEFNELIDDLKMTVVGGTQVNADTYTVTVVPTANYKWTSANDATYTWVINKATNSWVVAPGIDEVSEVINYFGETKFGTLIVEYKQKGADDSTYVAGLPANDAFGEYTARFTVASQSNFEGQTTTCDFKVFKVALLEARPLELFKEYSTKVGTQDSFVETGKTMIAGNNNAFKLQMTANGTFDGMTFFELDAFGIKYQVEMKVGELFESIDEQDIPNYMIIDTDKHEINFTTNALGETFKITVDALRKRESTESREYTVTVIDGYNAYTALDLSLITTTDDWGWAEFKAEHGYAGLTANAVILQNDITVYDEDIPQEYFYNEEEAAIAATNPKINLTASQIVGTMKDGYVTIHDNNDEETKGTQPLILRADNTFNIYQHLSKANETFGIYGNYFTVNYSNLTRCAIQSNMEKNVTEGRDGTILNTHTAFLGVNGTDEEDEQGNYTNLPEETENFFMQDFYVVGNAQRDDDAKYSGGITFTKIHGVNTTTKNIVVKDAFIAMMFSRDDNDPSTSQTDYAAHKVINSKAYNSYNSFIYVWGVENLYVEGGEYIGAGGPCMIVDHVGNDDGPTNGQQSHVYIVESKFESLIEGREPWFVNYGADALVPQIKAPNAYYKMEGTTFLTSSEDGERTGLMNLKVVYKSSDAEGLTSFENWGDVTFYDSKEDYDNRNTDGYINKANVSKLDMTANSGNTIKSGENQYHNSNTNAVLGSTTYVMYYGYVFKLGDLANVLSSFAIYSDEGKSESERQMAGLELQRLAAGEYEGNGISLFNKQTVQMQIVGEVSTGVQAIKINGNGGYLLLYGKYVVQQDAPKTVIGYANGTNLAVFITGMTNYTIDGTVVKDSSGNPVSEKGQMEQDGMTADVFILSGNAPEFATKSETGTTNLNVYLFNGMGIVVELYKDTSES